MPAWFFDKRTRAENGDLHDVPPSLIEVTTTELCAILSSIIRHGLHRNDFLSSIGSRAQSEKPLSVGLCRQAAIVPVKNVGLFPNIADTRTAS